MPRVLVLLAGLVAAALGSRSAGAYSSSALYTADPARTGGGGGRVFSGSPADGFTCAVCHTGAAPLPELRGFPGGSYKPGATYQLEITWPEEHFGIVVEATDEDGAPLGTLRLPPVDVLAADERCAGGSRAAGPIELADGRTAVAVGDCGAHLLRVQWTAPAEHVRGALHVAAVIADGDGTPAGDAAAVGTLPLGPEAAAGCAVDGSGGAGIGALLLLVLLRRRRGVMLLVILSLGTACGRVQPHQRGRLAQPDMQLNGDPDLGAGPEHALEYREGSAGGLGGGGGGCGCN